MIFIYTHLKFVVICKKENFEYWYVGENKNNRKRKKQTNKNHDLSVTLSQIKDLPESFELFL